MQLVCYRDGQSCCAKEEQTVQLCICACDALHVTYMWVYGFLLSLHTPPAMCKWQQVTGMFRPTSVISTSTWAYHRFRIMVLTET